METPTKELRKLFFDDFSGASMLKNVRLVL
jgi:hypothetical protein